MSNLTAANALEAAGIGLRTAVECGDLERIGQLLSAYGREVEQSLKSTLGDETEIAVLAKDTKKMFDWTRAKLLTARTEALADLNALNSNRSYVETGRSGVKSWEIDG